MAQRLVHGSKLALSWVRLYVLVNDDCVPVSTLGHSAHGRQQSKQKCLYSNSYHIDWHLLQK
jgi:hypothetical protein